MDSVHEGVGIKRHFGRDASGDRHDPSRRISRRHFGGESLESWAAPVTSWRRGWRQEEGLSPEEAIKQVEATGRDLYEATYFNDVITHEDVVKLIGGVE